MALGPLDVCVPFDRNLEAHVKTSTIAVLRRISEHLGIRVPGLDAYAESPQLTNVRMAREYADNYLLQLAERRRTEADQAVDEGV